MTRQRSALRPSDRRLNSRQLRRNSVQLGRALSARSQHRVGQWFKWLRPGLLIKRWMLLSILGFFAALLGAAIWADLTPVYFLLTTVQRGLGFVTQLLPNYWSGPLLLGIGLLLLYLGQSRTVGSITEALRPEQEEELVDVLLSHRRLSRGPRIVAIGGGTGLSTLLRGLKQYSTNLTAIVTVADDGGSSGRLRREMGVQPPGDIRNCLTALANEEKLLTELFRYRFASGDGLVGHSFGNLFLTAMTAVTGGDFEKAIAASSKVLAVQGQVLPATLSDMRLWAELEDGRRIEGESQITEAGGRIVRLGVTPADLPALPRALEAIAAADYIIIGPGSLFTSIIPNLLVPAIAKALAESSAYRVYVCNIMTQPGETLGYTVADHIRAIDSVYPEPLFDAVLVQRQPPSEAAVQRYAQQNSQPVKIDRDAVLQLGRQMILANVMEEDPQTHCVRHQPTRLAAALMRWYRHAAK
ncbi:gluconeogenesis factor YvcK family protein [Synechococcus elongatus]|uniref:gluconeogenesis factor YvcK family protein n=1 Tax=Synechococcus elongatus TaxID=32046 RepID=UPI0012A9D3F4|nr:YvcK family protein [Synechococcus elongatus PCC 11802]